MLIFGVGLIECALVWVAQFRGFYSLKTHEEWAKTFLQSILTLICAYTVTT